MGGRSASSMSSGSSFDTHARASQQQRDNIAGPDASVEMQEIIWGWTGLDMGPIRAATEDGTPHGNSKAAKLDNWLKEGSVDETIFRGINVDDATLAGLQVGATIDQKGISSWSTNSAVANRFSQMDPGSGTSNAVVFQMPGTRSGQSIARFSQIWTEREVAVSSASKQEITNISKKNGTTYITVKEV